jgi:hypothetical protein
VISYDVAMCCSHEAAHASAALMVGRTIKFVARNRHEVGGDTLLVTPSDGDPVWLAQSFATVLLAPLLEVGPQGADWDVQQAKYLGSFPGVDLEAAFDRTRALVKDPEFRRMHRVVEWGLWQHPTMTGEEVELLIAIEKENA